MNRSVVAILLAIVSSWSAVAADIPRPEHPRPDAERSHWLNLNGTWEFRFDGKNEGLDAGWEKPGAGGFDRKITVPFPWESELSGIKETAGPKVGWYRRTIEVPANFPKGNRIYLNFGAVDWEADAWVDGRKVVHHEGGYTPFSADITDFLSPGKPATLVVRAFDPTFPELPTGKQVGWYTPTSGIWQTVWLESKPRTHIGDFTIQTTLNSAKVTAQVDGVSGGQYVLTARSTDGSFQAEQTATVSEGSKLSLSVERQIENPKLWTPETPHIYDLVLTLKGPDGAIDEVKTYFGLRTIGRGRYGDEPYERILLNGKPIYLRIALDQSFNPKGIYTAPDDDFLKRDLMLAKYLGLNGLRIHIKPEEPRRLYWADRIGLLLFEDMPNTWRQTPKARLAWEATMREVVQRDKNHPSIIAWIAFNETWGLGTPDEYKRNTDTQAWVKQMVTAIRGLDVSRLVEDNSPCNYDHVNGSDLNSWHFYIEDHKAAKAHIEEVVKQTRPGSPFNFCPGQTQSTAPLINSEYGAVSAGGGDRDVSWGFRDLTTLLRMQPKIQGYVYTELTDIEWEHNGFADYNRGLKDFGYEHFLPDMRPNELNGDDFVGFDAPPVIVGRPGQVVSVPVFISHFSERPFEPKLRYWVDGVDENGDVAMVKSPVSIPARWTPYGVTWQAPIEVKLPEHPFVGSLILTLRDPDNRRFAANFVNLVVKETAVRAEQSGEDPKEVFLRFKPEDYARAKWSGGLNARAGKVSGKGVGSFEYHIKVPPAVVKAGVESIFFRAELAAKAGIDQVDWPNRPNPQDYPQTDERKAPTTLEIWINGRKVEQDTLEDDPADAQGVLSHLTGVDPGSYGYLIECLTKTTDADLAALREGKPLVIRLVVPQDAQFKGGLSVFGSESGKYPSDPILHLRTKEVAPLDLGLRDFTESVAVDLAKSRIRSLLTSGRASRSSSTEWAYQTTPPPRSWKTPEFDDSGWKRGRAGFGSSGTPGIVVRTEWSTSSIWMRTKVAVPKLSESDQLTLQLYHDEDVQIFVNGQLLLGRHGYVTSYEDIELNDKQRALFHPGENVISVSCQQTRGGQGVDVGLSLLPGTD